MQLEEIENINGKRIIIVGADEHLKQTLEYVRLLEATQKLNIGVSCIGVPAPGEKELRELAIDNEKLLIISAEELKNINGLDLVQSMTPIKYGLHDMGAFDIPMLNDNIKLCEPPFSKFDLSYKPKENMKYGNNRKGHTRKPKTKKTHRKKKK